MWAAAVAAAAVAGAVSRDAAVAAHLLAAVIGAALSVRDLRTRQLPDVLTVALLVALLGLLTVDSAQRGDWTDLMRAVLGAAALPAAYLTLALLRPGGLGMGDIKLSAPIGLLTAWHSWATLTASTVAAFLLAAAVGVVLLARGAGARTLPLGPFIVIGATVALVAAVV